VTIDPNLRHEVADLYAAYAACLDDGRYDEWPDFFTEDAWYRVVPRENYERNLPLSTISLKGRAMMKDRIYGVTNTIFHAPYYQRHLLSLPILKVSENGEINSIMSYTVIRTKRDANAEIYNVGQYKDILKRVDGSIKFRRKFCIFDNDIIPNSLIYPI
jgi:salicylate 5-hydroxylase small subunit